MSIKEFIEFLKQNNLWYGVMLIVSAVLIAAGYDVSEWDIPAMGETLAAIVSVIVLLILGDGGTTAIGNLLELLRRFLGFFNPLD